MMIKWRGAIFASAWTGRGGKPNIDMVGCDQWWGWDLPLQLPTALSILSPSTTVQKCCKTQELKTRHRDSAHLRSRTISHERRYY